MGGDGARDEDRRARQSESLRQPDAFPFPNVATPASDVGSGSSSGSNIGHNDMKRLSSRALSAGAILVLLSVTPAFAQVAGNPGGVHTRAFYIKQEKGPRGYNSKAT